MMLRILTVLSVLGLLATIPPTGSPTEAAEPAPETCRRLADQVDQRHGGWYESVSAEGNAKPGQAKATIWKAAYHDGRALMNVSERLRRLAP
jgi:hypothetical protein